MILDGEVVLLWAGNRRRSLTALNQEPAGSVVPVDYPPKTDMATARGWSGLPDDEERELQPSAVLRCLDVPEIDPTVLGGGIVVDATRLIQIILVVAPCV